MEIYSWTFFSDLQNKNDMVVANKHTHEWGVIDKSRLKKWITLLGLI